MVKTIPMKASKTNMTVIDKCTVTISSTGAPSCTTPTAGKKDLG